MNRLTKTLGEKTPTPSSSSTKLQWQRWCRLCAKEDEEGNVSVFCKSEGSGMDTSLATAIGKYFWVNIKPDDEISQLVCVECHTLMKSLISFTERVNTVQAMFCLLQKTNPSHTVDPNDVRLQYGLLDDERNHIIKDKPQKEQEHDDDDNDEEFEMIRLKQFQKEVESGAYTCEEEEEELLDEHHVVESEEERNEEVKGAEEEELNSITNENDFEFIMNDDATQVKIRRPTPVKRNLKPEIDQLQEVLTEDDKSADELEDSDLFRELKFNDEEGEEDHEEFNSEEEAEKRSRKQSLDDSHKSDVISSAKRRRGRPSNSAPDVTTDAKKPKVTPYNEGEADYKYICSICPKRYKNATSYRRHMMGTHSTTPDIPDFKCVTCDKIFPTEKQLGAHKRVHMTLEEKMDVACPFCERKFTQIAVMRLHVKGVHDKLKPFICDQCGRCLKTLAALNEHKLVHTTEAPWECEVCQKRFKNKARLKIHSDTHTETNYVCTECGMQLNTRRTLKMHMLVHSDEKQYKCDFCSTAFKRSKALKNHLILHTGLRPYKCNFCTKTFSNGSNCRSHKKKTHPVELAEEEAMGKKCEPTAVPKLEELRTCTSVIDNPRKVSRSTGGLSLQMRALLIAAEERAKRAQVKADSADAGADDLNVTFAEDCEEDDEDDDEEEETVIYEIIDEI